MTLGYSYPDSNTYYLNAYEEYQEQLEKEYYQSLPQRYDSIVECAIDILLGQTDEDLFYQTLEEYYYTDSDEYDSYVIGALDKWIEEGANSLDEIDYDIVKTLALRALRVSSEILYSESLDQYVEDGGWSLKAMIVEVMRG